MTADLLSNNHAHDANFDFVGNRFPSAIVAPTCHSSTKGGCGTVTTSMSSSPLSSEMRSPAEPGQTARATFVTSSINVRNDLPNEELYHKERHITTGHSSPVNSRQKFVCSNQIKRQHQQSDNYCGKMQQYSDKIALWRMDPNDSLSDCCLEITGVPDGIAIRKRRDRKRRSKQNRRRDRWIVEGLFLDMSDSDGDCCQDNRVQNTKHKPSSRNVSKLTDDAAESPLCFHLHKVSLAVGPRSCDYFSRLFRKHRTGNKDGANNLRLELPRSTIPAIPAMLDYIYDNDPFSPVHATTETAVPLRYLATIFGNRPLFDSATHFLQHDLRVETAISYLIHAHLFYQKKLAEVCIRLCAEEFDNLKIRRLAMLSPLLLEKVLHSNHFKSSNWHVVCSKIASYCRCQEHSLGESSFISLTHERVMPEICPEEALFFIKFMMKLGLDFENHGTLGRTLYERCVDAAPNVVRGVVDSLCHGNEMDRTAVSNAYGNQRQNRIACGEYAQLPAKIKVDLLEYAIAKQQDVVVEMDARYSGVTWY